MRWIGVAAAAIWALTPTSASANGVFIFILLDDLFSNSSEEAIHLGYSVLLLFLIFVVEVWIIRKTSRFKGGNLVAAVVVADLITVLVGPTALAIVALIIVPVVLMIAGVITALITQGQMFSVEGPISVLGPILANGLFGGMDFLLSWRAETYLLSKFLLVSRKDLLLPCLYANLASYSLMLVAFLAINNLDGWPGFIEGP